MLSTSSGSTQILNDPARGGGKKVMKGLFVGLATLDVIQLVERLPTENEKIRALDFAFAAGDLPPMLRWLSRTDIQS